MGEPNSELQSQWTPGTSGPSSSSHSRVPKTTSVNWRSIQISSSPSTPWPTEHQPEEWFSEILVAVEATNPRITSTIRSLSLAATSESTMRSICKICKQSQNELKRLTQMLLQTMDSSSRPPEGQQAFTPELVRKMEDSVWEKAIGLGRSSPR